MYKATQGNAQPGEQPAGGAQQPTEDVTDVPFEEVK